MARVPLLPTLLVAAAVATMIALGFWQLDRRGEKAALLATYAANRTAAVVALPQMGPVPAAVMYRPGRATCRRVIGWHTVGGRTREGASGFRYLAECARNVEGPGFVADMGVAEDPALRPAWQGGIVSGIITTEPVEGGLWRRLTGQAQVARPMIVAASPAPGLRATAPPDPASVANNHLAYAVQWFLFAAAAAGIYALALRQRWRARRLAEAEPPRG